MSEQPAPTEPANFALQWSENRPPCEKCRYDHCKAETPFGGFLITWKSWKKYDSPTVDETPWGDFWQAFATVELAKAACQREFDARLALCGLTQSAPVEHERVERLPDGKPSPTPPADRIAVAKLAAELRHFLAGYQQMRGLDREYIYSIHRGDAMEAHLRVSRLTRAADLLQQQAAELAECREALRRVRRWGFTFGSHYSPAAQAVIDAYHQELPPDNGPGGIAAALRTVADQVISSVPPPCAELDEFAKGFLVAHVVYRRELLAIAAELEGHSLYLNH